MQALLLGGNSLRNRDWLGDVQRQLAPLFTRTIPHQYAHWQQTSGSIDLDAELPGLRDEAASLDGEYGIFAKSAGSLLALKGIAQGALTPEWCVFVGLPLSFVREADFALPEWLAAIHVPVHIIQNTDDPTASFAQVAAYLRTHAPRITCSELPGSTHEYRDFAAIQAAIRAVSMK